MKKFTLYDRTNAAINCLASPEWPRVRRARKAATSFETPDVAISTETRTLAGRRVRIAEAGPTDGPLVVLLSPFPESILAFMGSWERLTEQLRVVAIDLPGFGASEGDRHDMSPSALGAALAEILDELDLREVHLVGPDVGMGAALCYALNPEHRLVSLAVGHGPGAPGPFKRGFLINMLSRFGAMRAMTAALGAGPLIAYSSMIGAIRHRPNPTQVDDFKRSYEGRGGEVVHWFTDFADKNAELAARVADIDLPTLVFWGELDVLFDVSNAENLHAALPKSDLRIVPEAGHHAWSDQPELFAEMVIDWATSGHESLR